MMKELDLVKITTTGDANVYPFSHICHWDVSDIIFKKLGPLSNSLLHVAASSGKEELTQLMARQFPTLIIQTNSHRDTPLHVAARVGMLGTAKILVDHAKEYHDLHPDEPDTLVMKNNEGNTALHEALLALQVAPKSKHSENPAEKGEDLAYFLAEHTGPEHVCNCENKANQSPLRLAFEYGNCHFLERFLKVVPDHVDCSATAKCLVQLMTEDKVNLEVLKLIHKEKPKLLDARDEARNTLLHSAASTGHLEEVRYLLEIMSDKLFHKNEQGSYAIHVASEKDYVEIVEALLEQWPYPHELLNSDGRSILHVAAKSGNEYLVRHILKSNKWAMLINMKDRDGNTPLHLAAMDSQCLVLGTLLLDKRTKADLKNNDGHIAYDIALDVVTQSDEKQDHKKNDKEVPDQQSEKDKHVHVKNGGDEIITGLPRHGVSTKNEKPSAPNSFGMLTTLSVLFFWYLCAVKNGSKLRRVEDLRNKVRRNKATEKEDFNQKINAFLVVATLIVGATFAASVQVGSSDMGDDKGDNSKNNKTTHLLYLHGTTIRKAERVVLRSFIVLETFAMILAVAAASILCAAQLIQTNLASTLVDFAYAVVALSLGYLVVAYGYSLLFKFHIYTLISGALIPLIILICLCYHFWFTLSPILSVGEAQILLFCYCLYWVYYGVYRLFTFVLPHRLFYVN